MELLAPWGLAALAGAPLILALYFLRRKHPPRVVGSLLLWAEARATVLRGRPWERFRPSVLLWLQLLVLLLLAIALSYPACVREGIRTQRLVLVLDASASMGASDGSPTRFSDALDQARRTVGAAPDGSEVAVLVAGASTRVAQPFTLDKGRLQATLDALEKRGPDQSPGDIQEAMLLAFQLGGTDTERRIVLLTDGAFPHDELPALPAGQLDIVAVGKGSANLAITTFELRRSPEQRFGGSAVVTVANRGDEALSGHLDVTLDGVTVEAHKVKLEPGEARTFGMPFTAESGRFTARLDGVVGDLLPTDDVAHAVLVPPRPVSIGLEGASPLLERAIAANENLRRAVSDETPDVTVYDGHFPMTPPAGRFLAIAPPDDNPLVAYGEPVERPSIATWDSGHPVLHHVDFARVRFGEIRSARVTAPLVALAEFAGEGGPALLAGQTPSWRGIVIPYPLHETDLPLKVAFPVLLYNAIGWLQPGGQSEDRAVATGQPILIAAAAGDQVKVRPPGDEARSTRVDGGTSDGAFRYADTARIGFYTVEHTRGADATTSAYGVSLTNAIESEIRPHRRLSPPRGPALVAADSVRHTESMVPIFLLLGLGIVCVEWLVFVRRAGGRGLG
jgi:Ca-activated chloride channel homolog